MLILTISTFLTVLPIFGVSMMFHHKNVANVLRRLFTSQASDSLAALVQAPPSDPMGLSRQQFFH